MKWPYTRVLNIVKVLRHGFKLMQKYTTGTYMCESAGGYAVLVSISAVLLAWHTHPVYEGFDK